ncbi:MAG: hypothetical protein IKR05_15330, partial [Prevotella sp.]|nr:hypothetical protein [Prevotella sp.]
MICFHFYYGEGAEAEPQHTEKKAETSIYEAISLGLHYFADAKIGGASEMNAKTSCFALHFSRLALSLPFKRRRISEKNHPA